jgi:hypothetical protein
MQVSLKSLLPYFLHLLLFGWGMSVSYYYGRVGIMPLDQSIVFDGAWRVLNGQVPFIDFVSPNGFIPIYLQTIAFAVLGVSWFSYLMHAAVLNGLFANMVFDFLRKLPTRQELTFSSVPLWNSSSFALASLSAVIFYPPFGVPYMEQHSFFFGMALLWLIGLLSRVRNNHHFFLLALICPFLIVFAWFSKQIPTALFAPFFLIYLLLLNPQRIRLATAALLAGGGCAGILLYFIAYQRGLSRNLLNYYYFDLAQRTGSDRLVIFGKPLKLLHQIQDIVFYSQLMPLIVAVGLIATVSSLDGLGQIITAKIIKKNTTARRCIPLFNSEAFLLGSLLMISLIFPLLTQQNPDNGKPFLFLAGGLANLYIGLRLRNPIGSFLRIGLILLCFWAAYCFNTTINRERLVHFEVESPVNRSVPFNMVPQELAHGTFDLPVSARNGRTSVEVAEDFTNLIHFLRHKSAPFFLLGDSAFLYGILGQPSVPPSLWFHSGLTVSAKDDKEFRNYQRELIKRIEKFGVRHVILEGEKTWLSSSLAGFPLLDKYIKERESKTISIGMFRILELS